MTSDIASSSGRAIAVADGAAGEVRQERAGSEGEGVRGKSECYLAFVRYARSAGIG